MTAEVVESPQTVKSFCSSPEIRYMCKQLVRRSDAPQSSWHRTLASDNISTSHLREIYLSEFCRMISESDFLRLKRIRKM